MKATDAISVPAALAGGAARAASPLMPGEAPARWSTAYAWSADWGGPGLTVRLFRCEFDVGEVPTFRIHVTADSRYRLWLNGERVGFGPAKGSLQRYHYETYELGPLLRRGRNVLAAEVRWFGINSPVSEVHGPVPGWLVQGPANAGVDTPGNWRVWATDAVTPDTTPYISNAANFLNHLERVALARQPDGWQNPGFDDSAWSDTTVTGPAVSHDAAFGVAAMRMLAPRTIAALTEVPTRFRRTIEQRREVAHRFGDRPAGWTVAAGAGGVVLLDAGEYVTGFPEFAFADGAGREVRVMYAEALGEWIEEDGRRVWRKAPVRDDFTRYEPHGYRDTLTLAGGERSWEPFYWRTFRFVQLEILPGPAPVTVRDVRYRYCVYPQAFAAEFASGDPQSGSIFEVSLRTFRVGAHEIYDDSPYYEQLSYTADTRIEALASLHLCNDPMLPRRTLQLFADTVRPDGLLDSRVPCQFARQTIPYFCLHWIFMLDDYWQWVGPADGAFVRGCLPIVDSILAFFRERLRSDGFLGPAGGWNMVDEVGEWRRGEPPSVTVGGSTYLTCLFIDALKTAARLHGQAGYLPDALRWLPLTDRLTLEVRGRAWDAAAGLFRERVEGPPEPFSQHAQMAAINAGVATPAQADHILRRLCSDPALIRTRSMQSFYLTLALERVGHLEQLHEAVLRPWRSALARHLTTWPEYPDPTRSDSHAWAAWPAVTYVTSVLGIRPAGPGWHGVILAPQTGGLEWAAGSAPSPAGPIRVDWRKRGGRLHFGAVVPDGLPTQIRLPGCAPETVRSGGRIEREGPA